MKHIPLVINKTLLLTVSLTAMFFSGCSRDLDGGSFFETFDKPGTSGVNLSVGNVVGLDVLLVWEDSADNPEPYTVVNLPVTYEIHMAQGSDINFSVVSTQNVMDVKEYVFSSSTPNSSYRFKIKSLYSDGSSDFSNIVHAQTQQSSGSYSPNAPTAIALNLVNGCDIQFDFHDSSQNEHSFEIELKFREWDWDCWQDDDCYWEPRSRTRFYSMDLSPEQKLNMGLRSIIQSIPGRVNQNNSGDLGYAPSDYRFRVKAINAQGESEYSEWSYMNDSPPESCF
ncbi:fibronectin type III domain-containing protein [bacterium]|nr:fibronectin type III domain-containing protein [bacterium]